MDGPDFDSTPLIPVIAQDATSSAVLMLAYMNADAYAETLRTGRVCYYSRSRDTLWRKGETSGHVQHLRQVFYDCDADTLLVKVEQVGGACHEGYESCFFREIDPATGTSRVIAERMFDPADVYESK
ncbi:MAG: phosphoribosyl-AMP cyclohydrolase [Gammaproteobacteria bacterium]|nr:phosphoribosyl-AMP cyclohydrolase [Gammaproteobacteria bacterium]